MQNIRQVIRHRLNLERTRESTALYWGPLLDGRSAVLRKGLRTLDDWAMRGPYWEIQLELTDLGSRRRHQTLNGVPGRPMQRVTVSVALNYREVMSPLRSLRTHPPCSIQRFFVPVVLASTRHVGLQHGHTSGIRPVLIRTYRY